MSTLSCSQCGRAAPADPDGLSRWKNGELVVAGRLEEAKGMLLCPSCVDEDDARAYDEGAGD